MGGIMKLVFVHGWSVTHTDTYGGLPDVLADPRFNGGLDIDIVNVWLGRYISFNDALTVNDLVAGLERALRDTLAPQGGDLPEFSCITHSTGGPVVREWIERYYGAAGLNRLPLRHLVMLAPANHGSPLARLGKERVGRIKAFFEGVEPGGGILRWLSLGSDDQWALTRKWHDYQCPQNNFYPFVLIGQTIDTAFYDFLNSYLTEVGSDGVVRVACANLNDLSLRLTETPGEEVENRQFPDDPKAALLALEGGIAAPREPIPLGVIPKASHSGTDIGIMASVTPKSAARKPVVAEIVNCLKVDSPAAYGNRRQELARLTEDTQKADTKSSRSRYVNMVFRIVDNDGNRVEDFDLYLLSGPDFDPAALPKGFFVDRQRNAESPNCLVYYLNYDKMKDLPENAFGIRVVARPNRGFVYYKPVEFRTDGIVLAQVLQPNQTVYVEIKLTRHVDPNVFLFDPASQPRHSFKGTVPKERP